MSSRRFRVETLGCKANTADSFAIANRLLASGLEQARPGEAADVCVVNSCTVTDSADRQSKAAAAKLHRLNPGAKIIYTGCGAELEKSATLHPDYGQVVPNHQKDGFFRRINETGPSLGSVFGYREMVSRHPMDREWPEADAFFDSHSETRRRAFLKIQEGCDAFCTYCVIPYGRGPSRSVSLVQILDRGRELATMGVQEVALAATNLGDFETASLRGPEALVHLLKDWIASPSLPRVRLTSLDPIEITPALIDLALRANGKICPHFHVSVQSTETRILKRMKRKYSTIHVEKCLYALSELGKGIPGGLSVGLDLITGFPGETEEEHLRSLERLARLPWTRIHVFPYSERTGTPATKLSGVVPRQIRARRADELLGLSMRRQQELAAARVGESAHVLFEHLKDGHWIGHTASYVRVRIAAQADTPALKNKRREVQFTHWVADPRAQDVSMVARLQ